MATLTATAEPLALNSGSSNVATLAIGGRPLAQAVVTAIHQTDWQGRLALSNQPRTNEVTYSNGAGGAGWGSWNGGTATVTYTQGQASPDGGTNATLVSVTGLTAGSVAGPNQGFGVPSSNAGTPFTLSVLMKAASASCVIKISLDGALYPTLQYAYFDLVAGTFSNVSAGATAFMRSIGGGWYLCAVSAPCGATATGVALDIFTSTIGSSSFYLLDTQWEAGNNAGARIRTSGAAITVTDYTQAGTQPQITLGQNPATGATLDWDGSGILPGQNWSWPLALPKISSDNFAYAPLVDNVLVTQMETGAPKRRRRFTYVPETLTGTLTLTGAQAATLETFVATTLRDVQPFDWKDLRDGSVASYIFTKRPTYTQVAGGVDLWSTAIELMKQ